MRFELKRTTATFGVFHPREEKNKGMAVDIPFRVTTDAIDMLATLMPAQVMEDETFDQDSILNELYTKEGHPRRPSINPIAIHRKPEGATVWIYDEKSDGTKKKALVLKPCNLRKLVLTLQTPFQIVLSGQVQYSQYNDEELVRLNSLSNKQFDIAIVIEQIDMFEAKEDKTEDDLEREQEDEARGDDDLGAEAGEDQEESQE